MIGVSQLHLIKIRDGWFTNVKKRPEKFLTDSIVVTSNTYNVTCQSKVRLKRVT